MPLTYPGANSAHGHYTGPRAHYNLTPPYDGGPQRLSCAEYSGCRGGARVAQCMYDGTHGVWPDQPRADELIWWWMQQAVAQEHL